MIAPGWIAGLARRRPSRLAGPAAGVALGVALVGSLGAFTTTAKAQMTRRAVQQVAVDWQVEVQQGGDAATVLAAIARLPNVRAAAPVGFATSTGFEASTGGSTQTTGPGAVLGLPAGYDRTFPGETRMLAGGPGVLLAQQTAANLHAGPGDSVSIGRPGLPPASVRVDGIVDLPAADSLFQRVGAPIGAQPQAPPDNVVLVPADRWHLLFDPIVNQAGATRMQVHARLDHRLPSDPSAAYASAASAARHLEADLAGTALVGNNLAATLDAARSDGLYAEVLFLLLGLPGLFIAGLLTRAVARSFSDSRRRELALLRTRGASLARLQRIAAIEAAAVAGAGAVAGLGVALLTGRLAFGAAAYGATRATTMTWAVLSVAAGVAVTLIAVAVPSRRDATAATVATARRVVGHARRPLVFRYGLDLLLIGASMLVFWAAGRSHYNLVLAPEGVPTVSVSWWALAAPLLLWVGIGLLAWRITDAVLDRGRAVVRAALTPLVGRLRGPAAATLRRQRRGLAAAVVLVTLSGAFAISTAVFDSTYRHQVGVDALLTNGAPVTVTAPPGGGLSPTSLAGIAGVAHAEPLQHRFVYVGDDLQDLYGVDPATIGAAGRLQDAYFAGGSARRLLDRLAHQPDAALVSAETVQDFQLRPGDRLRLRLRDAGTGRLTPVDFRYAGVVKEFPTAPTDSFVVANASYIAAQTGDRSVSTLLVSTHGASPGTVADRVRRALGPSATVTDIDHTRRVVGSSLTAVDLAGLTKIELAYALVFAVAASGLVLGLGLAQRRRGFAIVAALGASRRQQNAFARAEAAVLGILGGALAATAGWAITHVLVKVLTGVFDPPPATLVVPWAYLGAVAALAVAGTLTAVAAQALAVRGPVVEAVRDL